eukprot:gene5894-344_t
MSALSERVRKDLHEALEEYFRKNSHLEHFEQMADAIAATFEQTCTPHTNYSKDCALDRRWNLVSSITRKNAELQAKIE